MKFFNLWTHRLQPSYLFQFMSIHEHKNLFHLQIFPPNCFKLFFGLKKVLVFLCLQSFFYFNFWLPMMNANIALGFGIFPLQFPNLLSYPRGSIPCRQIGNGLCLACLSLVWAPIGSPRSGGVPRPPLFRWSLRVFLGAWRMPFPRPQIIRKTENFHFYFTRLAGWLFLQFHVVQDFLRRECDQKGCYYYIFHKHHHQDPSTNNLH